MSTAHCTAFTTLANSARTLSPAELTKRPRCCPIRPSMILQAAQEVESIDDDTEAVAAANWPEARKNLPAAYSAANGNGFAFAIR